MSKQISEIVFPNNPADKKIISDAIYELVQSKLRMQAEKDLQKEITANIKEEYEIPPTMLKYWANDAYDLEKKAEKDAKKELIDDGYDLYVGGDNRLNGDTPEYNPPTPTADQVKGEVFNKKPEPVVETLEDTVLKEPVVETLEEPVLKEPVVETLDTPVADTPDLTLDTPVADTPDLTLDTPVADTPDLTLDTPVVDTPDLTLDTPVIDDDLEAMFANL